MRPILKAVVFRRAQYHPIARARIDAIYAAGGSCPVGSATAKRLLSDFINAEGSRFGGALKRIHLPGFGNAGANAIDLVTGVSGSFPVAGGVTHGAGIVQGNGTTGYFDFGTNPVALGASSGNSSLFSLVKSYTTVSQQGLVGSTTSGITQGNLLQISYTDVGFYHPNLGGSAVVAAGSGGIFIGSATSTTNRFLFRRRSSGITSASDTDEQTASLSTLSILAMCRNLNGSPNAYANAELGCYGAGLGITTAEAEAFSANLKTLWEGLFQLSLP